MLTFGSDIFGDGLAVVLWGWCGPVMLVVVGLPGAADWRWWSVSERLVLWRWG
jgi:hypothetical protein